MPAPEPHDDAPPPDARGRRGAAPCAIRPATAADRAAVERVVDDAYRPWEPVIGMRPGPMDADHGALIRAGAVHVATAAGAVVAVLVLSRSGDAMVVDDVAVLPEAQGRGLGRRLMAFAEERARAEGRSAIRLVTHCRMARNLALYEALGYRRTGSIPAGAGQLVAMRKDLASA